MPVPDAAQPPHPAEIFRLQRLDDALGWAVLHAVDDIVPGWVGIPTVEWGHLMAAHLPPQPRQPGETPAEVECTVASPNPAPASPQGRETRGGMEAEV